MGIRGGQGVEASWDQSVGRMNGLAIRGGFGDSQSDIVIACYPSSSINLVGLFGSFIGLSSSFISLHITS